MSQVVHSESLLYLCTTIRASSDCFRTLWLAHRTKKTS